MSDVDRKVGQLDSDIHEIYNLLNSLDKGSNDVAARILRQEGRLNQIEADLQGLAEVQAEHTRALTAHTRALTDHTNTLAEHTRKLDRIIELLDKPISGH